MKANRRNFLKATSVITLGVAANISKAEKVFGVEGVTGAFELPPLGYGYDALEPYIDKQTMQIHHDKHHLMYVTKLNEAIETEPSLKGKSLDDLIRNINTIPENVRGAIRNQGGGHWNHSLFWQLLKKDTKPGEKTLAAINNSFGSMENFKKEFEKSAMGVFGSGWAWLILADGKLSICNTPNQDSPMMDIAAKRGKPIACIDVWEHAYYLKYQNKRAEYVQNFWNVLNWEKAENLIKG